MHTRRWASNGTARSGRTRAPPVNGLTRWGGRSSTPRRKSIESLLMFVAACRHTTPTAVRTKPMASKLLDSRHAIEVPRATPTRDAMKLRGCTALNQVRSEAILLPDRLATGEDADLDEAQGSGTRIDHGVLLTVNETRDRARAHLVGLPVRDDLSVALKEIKNLCVPVAMGWRLHARIHFREAHQHEVAVIRPHDLLVDDTRPNPLLPPLLGEVPYDRSHGPTPSSPHGRGISIQMITGNDGPPTCDDRDALGRPGPTRRRPKGLFRSQRVGRDLAGVRVPAARAPPPRARSPKRPASHGGRTSCCSRQAPPSISPERFRNPSGGGWRTRVRLAPAATQPGRLRSARGGVRGGRDAAGAERDRAGCRHALVPRG